MKFAIVVPARKNSKSILNKNIKVLKKKPLIEYTLSSVRKLKFKKFILTDSSKIKKISKKYGFITSYLRPKNVSTDKTSTSRTLLNFIGWLDINYPNNFDYLVVLQATSPLRSTKDITNAINIIKKKKFTSLFSVSESLEHPYETINVEKNKWKFNFPKSSKYSRRQDFDINSFFINGSIYIIKIDFLKKYKKMISNNHGISFMKKYNSLDINDLEDFRIAERLI